MVANMISNKNLHRTFTELFIRGRKYFFSFHRAIVLSSTKGCNTKYDTLLYNKDSKQTKASTKCCYT